MPDHALEVDIFWRQGDLPARATFRTGQGITALVGPSGAGKTTLARLLAGLDKPQGGRIAINGQVVFQKAKGRAVEPENRHIGFVFQDNALLPHLDVRNNVLFSPRADTQTCNKAIALTGLEKLTDAPVRQLSGGERKRVGIARAIAASPQLLILDEPFTGLDGPARTELMMLVQRINRENKTPILLITHQLEEVLQLADEAILMHERKAVVHGSLEDVLLETDALRLVGFEDAGSLLKGTITEIDDMLCHVDLGGDSVVLANPGVVKGSNITLRVRAGDIAIALKPVSGSSIVNQLEAAVSGIVDAATHIEISTQLKNSGAIVRARISHVSFDALKLTEGQEIVLLVKALSVKETSLKAR